MPIGLSPQVITECLFLLHRDQGVTVDQLDLVGSQTALATFQAQQHKVQSLYESWGIPADLPNINCHQTIEPWDRQAEGEILNIFVSILKQRRPQTETIILCLTAGYKHISFQSGYVFSLFAQENDWLVDAHAELSFANRGHFFPENAQEAKELWLTFINFVPLGSLLPKQAIDDYQDLLRLARVKINPPDVTLLKQKKYIQIGEYQIKLIAAEWVFYCWLAKRRQLGLPAINALDDWQDAYLSCYAQLIGVDNAYYENTIATLTDIESSQRYFQERLSRINRQLRQQLGEYLSQPYQIKTQGQRPNTRYYLDCGSAQIHFEFELAIN